MTRAAIYLTHGIVGAVGTLIACLLAANPDRIIAALSMIGLAALAVLP